jgi:hypothetical protein
MFQVLCPFQATSLFLLRLTRESLALILLGPNVGHKKSTVQAASSGLMA